MNVRKLTVALVVALAVIIASVAIFKPYRQPIRNFIVEKRAGWALDAIRKLTADQIITDDVVRATIRESDNRWGNLRGASWAAREAVFEKHQCYIFSIGYDNVENVCNTARYSEGRTNGNVWYEDEGIPVTIAPVIAEMRDELYRISRAYLASPDNLRTVFEVKKRVIVDEYGRQPVEKRQELQTLLTTAIGAFEQFRDDNTARVKYTHYVELENVWRADKSNSLDAFSAWQESGKELSEAVADMSLYLFAGRRWAEGGNELVSVYIEIMNDLKNALAG